MPTKQIPYDAPVTMRLEVPFETLNQDRLLKPTQIYPFSGLPATEWWKRSIGMTHADFYLAHHLGAVLTYLKVTIDPVELLPQQPIDVQFQTLLGAYPVAGKPPRFGGTDIFAISDTAGRRAARVEAYWLWFSLPPEGRPGTLQKPPPAFAPVEREFPAHRAYPEVTGEALRTFTWTRRETDLNQHVNSLAYLERAENALADASETTAATGDFEAWYLKPAFLGQRTRAFVVRGPQAIVRLAAEDGPTSAVLSFPGVR